MLENRKRKLKMKLDRFKKISGRAGEKARRLGTLAKAGLMFRSTRLVVGLVIVAYVIILAIDDFAKKGPDLRTWSREALGTDMMYALGLFALVSAFLIQSGVRRMVKTIWIIEHGQTATATAKGISERTVFSWFSRRFHPARKLFARCSFKDASGKSVKFEVIVPKKGSVNSGDPVDVVYDPGMPANAIALDALPSFVKTDPPLRVR